MSSVANKVQRGLLRARLIGAVPRFVYVHPTDVDAIGEVGAVCIVGDKRVTPGNCWVVENDEEHV